jgi:hypothetical protein
MPALRPIVREPRTSGERADATVFAIRQRFTPRAPDAHPGLLFTTDSAGMKVKPGLNGGFINPPKNSKFR